MSSIIRRLPKLRRFLSTPSDPYPLPLQSHTPSLLNDSELHPPPAPLPRHNESLDTLRARLIYQSRKRGTLESGLLLSTFANEHMPTMSEGEMKEFDKLMDEPDWDVFYWCTNKRSPPERWAKSSLLEKLKTHVKNEGRVARRMPDLDA